MSNPVIIITGANGFIGEQLVNYFHKKNWDVKALVHRFPEHELNGVEYIQYNIEEKVNEHIFASADYLVHCAYLRYEKNKNADSFNINGTRELISLCRKYNTKPLFLSSFSAHAEAESHYGKTKLACEQLFDLSADVILKPGFVIGKKGLCGEIINQMKRAKFFPLVGGGIQQLQSIYIDDLITIIEHVLIANKVGLYHVAEPTAVSMKVFYSELAKQLNIKVKFIPISLPFLFTICKTSEAIGIKLPVSSESVLGLKHLIKFDTAEDLKKIGVNVRNYNESIQSLLK